VSKDPIGFGGGINQFSYVKNSPIVNIDAYGLFDFKWYGNWGGPGWTAGLWTSWDKMSVEERKNAVDPMSMSFPVDKQDYCYMRHDIGYGSCREKCDSSGNRLMCERSCFNKIDIILSKELISIGIMKNPVDEMQRLLAVPVFVLQPGFRNGGVSEEGKYYQLRYSF